MELWELDHPHLGVIQVEIISEAGEPPLDATFVERVKHRFTHPGRGCRVRVGEQITTTHDRIPSEKFDIFPSEDSFEATDRLRVRRNVAGEVLAIDFFGADGSFVEFDPPPGSRGEVWEQSLQSSTAKRVLYPIAFGFGKAGWAIFLFLVLPILSRLLPDWDIDFPRMTWPSIDLPVIEIPAVTLPIPTMPSIHLPAPHLPTLKMPELPEWMVFMLDNPKMWVPVVAGIILGIGSLRNRRRSELTKRQWQAPPLEQAQPERKGTNSSEH